MADSVSRFESVVDQQIRAAQERGDFDDLPGKGKPLPGWGGQDDDLWWLKGYLHREGLSTGALLPASLRLAKEIEQLPGTVGRLPSEQAVREAVSELNRRIAQHLRAPSGPYVPVRPIDPDDLVRRWWAAQEPPADHPAPAAPAVPDGGMAEAPPALNCRRRWFGRLHRRSA